MLGADIACSFDKVGALYYDSCVYGDTHITTPWNNMYLLTEWECRTGKYLARGPYVLTERQIFSRPARPYSVHKHFITWPLNCWKFWKFCLNLNRTRLHNIRRPRVEQPQKRFYNKNLSFISSRRTRNAQFIEKHDSFSHICFSI